MPIRTSQNFTPRQLQAADLLARGVQSLVEPALQALKDDLTAENVPRAIRIKAAIAVLDRAGFGPAQAVDLSGGGEVKLEVLSREARVKLLDELMGGEGPEDTTLMDMGDTEADFA